MYKEALEIDLKLLSREDQFDQMGMFLLRATRISTELHRTSDVKPFALHYLKNLEDDWQIKLTILAWYVKCFPDNKELNTKNFEKFLSNICHTMGLDIQATSSFNDRVSYLYSEVQRGGLRLRDFHNAYFNADANKRQAIVEAFLEADNSQYYKKQVEKYLI